MARIIDQTKQIPICSTQLKTMEMIMDYVNSGYIYWTIGEIKPEEIKEKLNYFVQHYSILDSKDQRYYKKKNGKANHQLILFNPFFGSNATEEKKKLWYILMATDGGSIFFKAENFRNTSKKGQRISFLNYEFAEYTDKINQKQRYSWRLIDKQFNEYKDCIVDAIRHAHHNNLKMILFEIARLRGYHLVCQQYLELMSIARKEVTKKHGRAANLEGLVNEKVKAKISYVRFSSDIIDLTVGEFLRGKLKEKKEKASKKCQPTSVDGASQQSINS